MIRLRSSRTVIATSATVGVVAVAVLFRLVVLDGSGWSAPVRLLVDGPIAVGVGALGVSVLGRWVELPVDSARVASFGAISGGIAIVWSAGRRLVEVVNGDPLTGDSVVLIAAAVIATAAGLAALETWYGDEGGRPTRIGR